MNTNMLKKSMELKEHSSCFYFGYRDRPIAEILDFGEEETGKPVFLKNKIVFVISGGIHLTYENRIKKYVKKGNFFFIPSGAELVYMTTCKCSLFVLRLHFDNYFCEGCRLEKLFDEKHYDIPKTYLCTLKTNSMLLHCLDCLILAFEEGFQCRHFYSLKMKEMVTIIRSFYPRTDLQKFFSPIFSSDMLFTEAVRKNFRKFKTVAKLADSMNMSAKNFTKKFTTVFGITPLLWMNQEKAKRIFSELSTGNKPLSIISDEYGFKAQPHLNTFCKREFGKNPSDIRKNAKKRSNV